jgi:NADP-dependent 3-hydroxy acid dehydrogenase YdfG
MKSILIFGATGGIGCYTADHFIKGGYSTICVGGRKTDNGFFKNLGALAYYSVDLVNRIYCI